MRHQASRHLLHGGRLLCRSAQYLRPSRPALQSPLPKATAAPSARVHPHRIAADPESPARMSRLCAYLRECHWKPGRLCPEGAEPISRSPEHRSRILRPVDGNPINQDVFGFRECRSSCIMGPSTAATSHIPMSSGNLSCKEAARGIPCRQLPYDPNNLVVP